MSNNPPVFIWETRIAAWRPATRRTKFALTEPFRKTDFTIAVSSHTYLNQDNGLFSVFTVVEGKCDVDPHHQVIMGVAVPEPGQSTVVLEIPSFNHHWPIVELVTLEPHTDFLKKLWALFGNTPE